MNNLNKNFAYPYIRRIGKSVSNCPLEATLYANCCTAKSLNINQYDCQREFEKLTLCVKNNFKNIK